MGIEVLPGLLGIAFAIGLSNTGAAYGISKASVGICGVA